MSSLFPTVEERRVATPQIVNGIRTEKHGIAAARSYIKEKREELEVELSQNKEYYDTATQYRELSRRKAQLRKKAISENVTAQEIIGDIKTCRENLKNHQLTLSGYLEEYLKVSSTPNFENETVIKSYKLVNPKRI